MVPMALNAYSPRSNVDPILNYLKTMGSSRAKINEVVTKALDMQRGDTLTMVEIYNDLIDETLNRLHSIGWNEERAKAIINEWSTHTVANRLFHISFMGKPVDYVDQVLARYVEGAHPGSLKVNVKAIN